MRPERVCALAVALFVAFAVPAQAAGPPPIDLRFDAAWGTKGNGPGQFEEPQAVAVDTTGNVYVIGERQDRVQQFDSSGAFVRQWGSTGREPGSFKHPSGIACDRFGFVYVADSGNERVQVFDSRGRFVREFGTGPVSDVAVAMDGRVFTRSGSEFHSCSPGGRHLASWSVPGTVAAMAANVGGELFVARDRPQGASAGDAIMWYAYDGTLLSSWGDNGRMPGQLAHPSGVSVDPLGRLLVSDMDADRLQVFTQGGQNLGAFGSEGSVEGCFESPARVAAGWRRDVFVADTMNSRVEKFGTSAPTVMTAVEGPDRVATSIAASRAAYPGGAAKVLVATSRNWPDALGGAALSNVDDCPILLTPPDALSPAVAAEIERLGARTAVILGSDRAVSASVESALEVKLGDENVGRVGGSDRYETARMIAGRAVKAQGSDFRKTAFVATGDNFPDALAASPVAVANGWPIYLATGDGLRADAKAQMVAEGVSKVYILGSTRAVSAAVERDLVSTFGTAGVVRIGGEDRYETAAMLADFSLTDAGMTTARLALAIGEDFPDALSAGPLQGHDYSILLLTRRTSLPPVTASRLEALKDRIHEVRYLGSTRAVGQGVRDEAGGLLW